MKRITSDSDNLWRMIHETKFTEENLELEIFTDGSHKGRWGSWAYVIVCENVVQHENSGRERRTNSHRMEFQAVIEALKNLPQNSVATIRTDSRELIKTFTLPRKRSAANADQIQILDRLLPQHRISWKWIKAHSGEIHNERCDSLCIAARTISP